MLNRMSPLCYWQWILWVCFNFYFFFLYWWRQKLGCFLMFEIMVLLWGINSVIQSIVPVCLFFELFAVNSFNILTPWELCPVLVSAMHRVGSTGNTNNSSRPRKEKRLAYIISDSDGTKVNFSFFSHFVTAKSIQMWWLFLVSCVVDHFKFEHIVLQMCLKLCQLFGFDWVCL